MIIRSFATRFNRLLLLLVTLAVSSVAHDVARAQKEQPQSTQYIFPMPSSTALPRATSIIIRPGSVLNPATVNVALMAVSGSFSGKHSGTLHLSDDKKTLIFTPTTLFTYGERVTVKLSSGIRTSVGMLVDPVSFYFTIQSPIKKGMTTLSATQPNMQNRDYLCDVALPAPEDRRFTTLADAPFIPAIDNHPTPGAIILAPYYAGPQTFPVSSYLSIIDDTGHTLWGAASLDVMQTFQLNPDGRYSYFDEFANRFYAMDSAFTIVDSFQCAGGYLTDYHDFSLLPHDHALLLGFDTENDVDLSKLVTGGDPQATILGVVVMEIDSSKQPVFIWRSRDSGHYLLQDMIDYPSELTSPTVDAVHANAVFKDTDDNYVLSARHLDEITKISSETGMIIWRFGGKHNQFTLTGDSMWFSHQHDVRRIENGDITLFDNGNDRSYHTPPASSYSRACEYQIDETAKTAKLVWQFDEGKTDTSTSQGSVQRLSNGNTFISWGDNNYYTKYGPAMTEVRPDGTIAFEMSFAPPYITYRAFRLPANTPGFVDDVAQSSHEIASSPSLSMPYPNPCAGFTNLTVNMPSSMSVDLRVYDALGHEVSRLASGLLVAGGHSFGFDAAGLANGVYHCVLRSESGIVAREIIVAK